MPLRCKTPPDKETLEKYRDIQLIDPAYIAGKEHLESAISQSETAFNRSDNISTSPLIEVVVRASLNRQIKTAFELFGLKGSGDVVAISEDYPEQFIEEYGCTEDRSMLDVDEEKYEKIKDALGINEDEIIAVSGGGFEDRVETLQRIIAERMALLNKV